MSQEKLIIIFDGGTTCNIPSKGFGGGYGSFKVGDHEIQRVKFGVGHSANSAEVRTLVEALRYAKEHFDKSILSHGIIVYGDSKIALKWLKSPGFFMPTSYKGKEPTQNFVEAVKLLKEARKGLNTQVQWQPRKESVKLFGH